MLSTFPGLGVWCGWMEMHWDETGLQWSSGEAPFAIIEMSQTLENSSSTSANNGVWHLKQDYLDHLWNLNNDLVPSLVIIHAFQYKKNKTYCLCRNK